MALQNNFEVAFQIGRPHIAKTEKDDAWQSRAAPGNQLGKIEIVGDDNPPFLPRLHENSRIGKALKPFVEEMGGLVALIAQKFGSAGRNAHIEQKLHAAVSIGWTVSSANQAA